MLAVLGILPCLSAADLLPEEPPDGLRMELTLECDFTEHFWNVVVFYDRLYPVDLRFRLPARIFERTRAIAQDVPYEERMALYGTVRGLVDRYQLGMGVRPAAGDEAPRPGVDVRAREERGSTAAPAYVAERTLTLSLLTVREGLGRVDELVLALDLTDRRIAPEGLGPLAEALRALDRRLDMELTCAPD